MSYQGRGVSMIGFFKKKKEVLKFPVECEKIDLALVPDVVFSQKMLGDGVAIIPKGSIICAPCDCEVVQIFPTNHAIGLVTPLGLELLIHIGIDTVELKGEGFKRIASPGDYLKEGEPLVEVDLTLIKNAKKAIETPIVITNMEKVQSIDVTDKDILMTITLK